jgi:hypothetical protein
MFPELILRRFVVYAASAIYIVGIPEIKLEYGINEQEALLGLSLYVLACEWLQCKKSRNKADPLIQTVWAL